MNSINPQVGGFVETNILTSIPISCWCYVLYILEEFRTIIYYLIWINTTGPLILHVLSITVNALLESINTARILRGPMKRKLIFMIILYQCILNFLALIFIFNIHQKQSKCTDLFFNYCYHDKQTLCFISGKNIFWSKKSVWLPAVKRIENPSPIT